MKYKRYVEAPSYAHGNKYTRSHLGGRTGARWYYTCRPSLHSIKPRTPDQTTPNWQDGDKAPMDRRSLRQTNRGIMLLTCSDVLRGPTASTASVGRKPERWPKAHIITITTGHIPALQGRLQTDTVQTTAREARHWWEAGIKQRETRGSVGDV